MAASYLGHLEGVGQSGALMVRREDEDLRLAGQPAERGRVKDPIPVALEACPPGIGVLRPNPPARAR